MKFCGQCGALLRHDAGDAELRQLTVLFCDLVSSTALAETLDPEDLREVLSAYHAVCAEVIGRYEGHVAQYLGDGILVYFGYPAAHEDDARRGVRTGLELANGVAALSQRLKVERGFELNVRVGIHTGPVIIGEVGSGDRHEHLALGTAPNVAARIQNVALPGTVLVSDATYRIVRGFFDFVALGAYEFRGLAEAVRLHRAVGESGAESRLDVARRFGLTPLTGRATELKFLEDAWQSVTDEAGESRTVLVRGEAGIGKSRIVSSLRERVEAQSAIVLECSCSPYSQNSTLLPIIAMAERLLGFTRETSDADKLVALESRLARRGLLSSEVRALMAQLLSIPLAAEDTPLDLLPQQQRERTLQILRSWLLAVAQAGPTLWIVEDLHWADPTTLEFVKSVVSSRSAVPLLAILTFRPEFELAWRTNGGFSTVTLNRLTPEETSTMVARVAGNKPLPVEVVRRLVTRTEGVPLFVEEVTKAALELGVMEEREDRYELAGPMPADFIPATVQESLAARLDRLGPAKPIAQLAATIGREFRFDVLSAVASVDEATLRQSLDSLVGAELIYQTAGPPDETYLFKHALIQDAAYQSVLRKSRREIHGRIGEALISRFSSIAETRPELVAEHFSSAAATQQAVAWWLRAGQLALGRAANHEAIAHLTRGLELLRGTPESPARLEQELEFNIALTPALQMTRGWASPDVDRIFRRSGELLERLGSSPHQLTVLANTFAFHLLAGRVTQALAIGKQVLELAKTVGEPALMFIGHGNCCVAHLYHGDVRSALEHAEAALPLFTVEREQWITRVAGMAGRVYMNCYYSEALWMLGSPDQAVQASERSVSLAREWGHMPSLTFALSYQTEFYHLLRDSSRVLAMAEESLRLGREQRSAFWDPVATTYKGWALASEGKLDEGIALMRDGIARYQSAGNGLTQVHLLALLAEGLSDAERWDDALDVLSDAMALAKTQGEGYYESELYRLRGEVLRARSVGTGDQASQLAAAGDSIRHAMEIARRQEARSLELRAAVSLCRLQRAQGDASEGRQVLADLYSSFDEGLHTPDLRGARELLDALAG